MTAHDTPTESSPARRIDGFLLTRHWRDWRQTGSLSQRNARDGTTGKHQGGVNLDYWASTELGPLKISVPGESAVCFIDRQREIANSVLSNVTRKAVDLKLLDGDDVDALYFYNQRDLSLIHI